MDASCIFCRIIDGQLPAAVVWDSESVVVIKDRYPKAQHHLLVIPKVHVPDIIAAAGYPEVIESMMHGIRAVANTVPGMKQFRLVCNTGSAAGQSVFHVHMHMLAGADLADF